MISSLVELCHRLWWLVSGSFLLGSSWDRLQHWDQDSRKPELVSSFQCWGNESFNTLSILSFTYPQHRSSGILRRMRDFVFVASFPLLTYAGCSNLSTRTASACCFVCHPKSGTVAVASVLSTGKEVFGKGELCTATGGFQVLAVVYLELHLILKLLSALNVLFLETARGRRQLVVGEW